MLQAESIAGPRRSRTPAGSSAVARANERRANVTQDAAGGRLPALGALRTPPLPRRPGQPAPPLLLPVLAGRGPPPQAVRPARGPGPGAGAVPGPSAGPARAGRLARTLAADGGPGP